MIVADHDESLAGSGWRRLNRRRIYENSWIAVDKDVILLPAGARTLYGIVRCGPCVGMLPFGDADHVLLVQQFRYITQQNTWEMPTGGVHSGESIEAAAQRELAEEVGARADRLTPLTAYATSKSVVTRPPTCSSPMTSSPHLPSPTRPSTSAPTRSHSPKRCRWSCPRRSSTR